VCSKLTCFLSGLNVAKGQSVDDRHTGIFCVVRIIIQMQHAFGVQMKALRVEVQMAGHFFAGWSLEGEDLTRTTNRF
jgi:hypothetical protein